MSGSGIKKFASDLRQLGADIDGVAKDAGPSINSAVQQTAVAVKNTARDRVRERTYFKGAAQAIDYELSTFRGFGVSILKAEIGYNKDRPGAAFGHILEYGAPNANLFVTAKKSDGTFVDVPVPGVKRPLAPGGELQFALQQNEAAFMKNIHDQLEKLMRTRNL